MDSCIYGNPKPLIAEVQKRPLLYDPQHPDNGNKLKRLEAWQEICEKICHKYSELSAAKQAEEVKDVQKRWKGVRDAFRRELRLQNTPGGARKSKYRYYDHLKFLATCYPKPKEWGSSSSPNDIDVDCVSDSEDKSINSDADPLDTGRFEQSDVKVEPTEVWDPTKSIIIKATTNKDEVFDDDKAFLLSLLPTMKRFNEMDKMTVRVEIMNAIKRAKTDTYMRHNMMSMFD